MDLATKILNRAMQILKFIVVRLPVALWYIAFNELFKREPDKYQSIIDIYWDGNNQNISRDYTTLTQDVVRRWRRKPVEAVWLSVLSVGMFLGMMSILYLLPMVFAMMLGMFLYAFVIWAGATGAWITFGIIMVFASSALVLYYLDKKETDT